MLRRLANSFSPLASATPTPETSDLYGPLMLSLTLGAILLLGMKLEQYSLSGEWLGQWLWWYLSFQWVSVVLRSTFLLPPLLAPSLILCPYSPRVSTFFHRGCVADRFLCFTRLLNL